MYLSLSLVFTVIVFAIVTVMTALKLSSYRQLDSSCGIALTSTR